MQPTKTGAIICKKKIAGSEQLEYEAAVFITDIPLDVTDTELAIIVSDRIKVMNAEECLELIIRADINSTSNEVWEQYGGLNNDAGKGDKISYHALMVSKT